MMREKGLVFRLVESAKTWFPDETARFNFFVDMIRVIEEEGWELCRPEAVEIDPVFEKALKKTHPELN